MSLRLLTWTGVAGTLLPAGALGQLCPMPCIGDMIVCHRQNGVRNHRGEPATPIEGPNAATGNVLGDAFWKLWGCENGMTRGAGVTTFTNWEIGAANGGAAPAAFELPDLGLRPIANPSLAFVVREPDLSVSPMAAYAVGSISLPTGALRINVSIQSPAVALPGSCPPTTSLATLPNADVAMLFLLTPGEASTSPTYYRNLRTNGEVNTISNPPVGLPGPGNSYSGTVDAALDAVSHFPVDQELYAQMGFFEPTLESHRLTTGFATPGRGSGARELAPGDSFFLASRDWEARVAALGGVDRLAAVVVSDDSSGVPLCLGPPFAFNPFLAGSLFLPGSAGVLALFPTPMTLGHLGFSATLGAWLNCHATNEPAPPCGVCPCQPSASSVVQASTAAMTVPPGLSGMVIYAAAFYLNLSTFTLDDGSNTVELLFL